MRQVELARRSALPSPVSFVRTTQNCVDSRSLFQGPTAPERIRYHVDGNKVAVQWEEPRVTNAPMEDYEVTSLPHYTRMHNHA